MAGPHPHVEAVLGSTPGGDEFPPELRRSRSLNSSTGLADGHDMWDTAAHGKPEYTLRWLASAPDFVLEQEGQFGGAETCAYTQHYTTNTASGWVEMVDRKIDQLVIVLTRHPEGRDRSMLKEETEVCDGSLLLGHCRYHATNCEKQPATIAVCLEFFLDGSHKFDDVALVV